MSAVVDYLQCLDYVNADSIVVLGICAGGGYAVAAATTDHRIKAVATISAVNIGDSFRRGWLRDAEPEDHNIVLEQTAQQLQAQSQGGNQNFLQ